MFTRFRNSWNLLTRSLSILSDNKRLLVFPIVTFLCTAVILVFFFGAVLLRNTGYEYTDKNHWKQVAATFFTAESLERVKDSSRQSGRTEEKQQLQLNETGVVLVAFVYFLSMFLATFFNVAFYHEIIRALQGDGVDLGRGFAFAVSRLGPIFMWSMFAGLVGYLIKMLEEKFGLVGKITLRIIGATWSVASVFAIPIIVCREEAGNPVAVLRESAQTIKKTWGESLIGFAGMSGVTIVVVLLSTSVFMALGFVAATAKVALAVPALTVAWLLFMVAFAYIASVAGHVYQCALYLFASSGAAPVGYSANEMASAWKQKR